MRLVWGLLVTLAGAIGVIAYLVVAKPVRMGILVTDQHGNPVGAIQPVSATGDVPAALVNAFTGFNDIKRFRQLIATHGNDRDAVLTAWLAD